MVTVRINAWDKRRCMIEFALNSTMSLKELSRRSQRSVYTLNQWKDEDNWEAWRQAFAKTADEEILKRSSDKVADILSEKYSDIAMYHFETYRNYTELANLYAISCKKMLIKASNQSPEALTKAIKSISAKELNYWSQVCDRSIKGEHMAANLEHLHNPNQAIKLIEDQDKVVVNRETWNKVEKLLADFAIKN